MTEAETFSVLDDPVPHPKARPYLPLSLRGPYVYDPGLPVSKRIAAYGKWEVEIIRDCVVSNSGQTATAGKRLIMTGDVARELTLLGLARFDDPQAKHQEQIIAEARKIERTNPVRLNPERYQHTPQIPERPVAQKRSGWMNNLIYRTPGNT